MEHHIFKTFPSNVPFFSLLLTKVDFPFSHHLLCKAWPPKARPWGTMDTRHGICCGSEMLHPALSPDTILDHPVSCSASLQQWESQAAPALCKVHGFASTKGGTASLGILDCLFAVALVNLEVFLFQVSLSQACAWVTLRSWGHGTALSICLCKWWIRGGCGEKKPTKNKRCCGRTVSLKGILKSLNTENIIAKEPELIIFKTHQLKL